MTKSVFQALRVDFGYCYCLYATLSLGYFEYATILINDKTYEDLT